MSAGIPVATNAFPSDHFMRSSAFASASFVGFESGKIIGCAEFSHITSTISFVNEFGFVDVPTKIVALTVLTTSSKLVNLSGFAKSERFFAKGFCSGVRSSISSNRRPCLSTMKKRL